MAEYSDDDGFNDFLSEDEEAGTMQAQELAAVQRKMKTVGIRDGVDFGKEDTLQRGFDEGFESAARRCFDLGVVRGALCSAVAIGLTSDLDAADQARVTACITALHEATRAPVTDDAASSKEELHNEGTELLRRIGLVATAAALPPRSSSST